MLSNCSLVFSDFGHYIMVHLHTMILIALTGSLSSFGFDL
jgi:hypothetical protein